MKRLLCATLTLFFIFTLVSCSPDTYTLVHYENMSLMRDNIGFDMAEVPGLDTPVAFAAADGSLGELTYGIVDELLGEGTLVFRMATADYAAKYSAETGGPGISPIPADSEISSEKLGSAAVTYYAGGSSVIAVWELGGYAYAAVLSYNSGDNVIGRDSIYPYVLSVIAS